MEEEKNKVDTKLKELTFVTSIPEKVLRLANGSGRCDMRCFMLVASTRPKYAVYLYKEPLYKASL